MLAVLGKNYILQTRSRKTFFGLGGWLGLLLQILVPVMFFGLMYIPKYYIHPLHQPRFIDRSNNDIDLNWWAGFKAYDGPAASNGANATIIFAPDTPKVREVVKLFSMAVGCPKNEAKRLCSPTNPSNFYCYFRAQGAPPSCKNSSVCMSSPACHDPVLAEHVIVMGSEPEALNFVASQPLAVDAVVVFDPQDVLKYAIRMNHSDVPTTRFITDFFDVHPGPMAVDGNGLWLYRKYWFFVNLQLNIDRALLGLSREQPEDKQPLDVEVKVKPFPWPSKTEDLGSAVAAAFFNLLLVYAFMAPTRVVVGSIVREKELRLREGMRILGLSEGAYWSSWAVTHWTTLALSGLLVAIVGLYPFQASSFSLMVMFYFLFSAALVAFSYFISTWFQQSRVAGTATQFVYALSMIPGFLLPLIQPYGGTSWFLACLSPPSAASLFAYCLINWERIAAGVTWRTWDLPVTQNTSFCVRTVMVMMLADVLLYSLLTWYGDKVFPNVYGRTYPPWFFLLPSYWCHHEADQGGLYQDMGVPLLAEEQRGEGDEGVAVRVMGLSKVYYTAEGGHRLAVDQVNMEFHRGQVTALLGHNGAGKTTTIHMLTGMISPTAGTALIDGLDINQDMAVIRHSLGICPQFDILWPDITVQEHLQLYGLIKGYSRREVPEVAKKAAQELGLGEKLDVLAGELSGGQRRKLSVAIAFLGNPAVVFLDEPTSGMDPYSCRFTWEVIRNHKQHTAVVLTTHSMEEADILCDHIIVMSEGRVAAEGSPHDLKCRYGVGYTMTMVLDRPRETSLTGEGTPGAGRSQGPCPGPEAAEVPFSNSSRTRMVEMSSSSGGGDARGRQGSCDLPEPKSAPQAQGSCRSSLTPSPAPSTASRPRTPEGPWDYMKVVRARLEDVVGQHVTGARVVAASGSEMTFQLPREASGSFAGLLRYLEANKKELSVLSYGLSVTTLEEVFLEITKERDLEQDNGRGSAKGPDTVGSCLGSRLSADADGAEPVRAWRRDADGQGQGTSRLGDEEQQGAQLVYGRRHGVALYLTQLYALFIKRALCARRDRLAVITQLLVPFLLVYIALWFSHLQISAADEQPLVMTRNVCMRGRPAVLAASASVRGHQAQGLGDFLDAYPRSLIQDSLKSELYSSMQSNLSSTLEGYLLSRWYSGSLLYDAVYLDQISTGKEMQAGLGQVGLTLMVNQSAISALPAALNEATSTLMRMMAAGRGQMGPVKSQSSLSGLVRTSSVGDATGEMSTRTMGSGNKRWLPVVHPLAHQDLVEPHDSGPSESIQCTGAPLPVLPHELRQQVRQQEAGLMLVLCLTMASSVLSASFVVFLVREKDSDSKHVQLVSGAAVSAYWLSTYLWDLVNFSVSAGGILLLFVVYHLPQFWGPRLAAVAVLLWVFGLAGVALTSLLHFGFKDEMKALQRLNTLYFLVGYLGFLATWIMDLIHAFLHPPHVHQISYHLNQLLQLISPHYCFAKGIYAVQQTYLPDPISGLIPGGGGQKEHTSPWTTDVVGQPVQHMLMQAMVYGALVLWVDSDAWVRLKVQGHGLLQQASTVFWKRTSAQHPHEMSMGSSSNRALEGVGDALEDDDVKQERVSIKNGEQEECEVLIRGLAKSYGQGYRRPPVHALRDLWVGVPPGECFGLLGVNGAGKTTTFKILTGEILPDRGQAFVHGYSVLSDLGSARQSLGYCPQFEALPGAMTGREVLWMYARLRGVPEALIPTMVSHLLARLGLSKYADNVCSSYSGGNKRKLSVAVALVGNAPVVMLDEPSTGMDPGARRSLWTIILEEVVGAGHTVVLTSHSMEECEALCTKIGILAAGSLTCLGTVQHLKTRYGAGYSLELRYATPEGGQVSPWGGCPSPRMTTGTPTTNPEGAKDEEAAGSQQTHSLLLGGGPEQRNRLISFIHDLCPSPSLVEEDYGRLLFALPRESVDLATLFESVESQKDSLGILDYSLSQTTLEQIFLKLAGAQQQQQQQQGM